MYAFYSNIHHIARLMIKRYKPEIYHIELHRNTDKEPMVSAVCFCFFQVD